MKSKVLAGLFLGLLLIGSIATKPVLATPHHIIISKHEFNAKPGDVLTIPFEIFFSQVQQAKLELYGDKMAGWGCSLQAPSNITVNKGDKINCGLVVPIPSTVSDGTYGLILQDLDKNGQVTSRVSIFIIIGSGENQIQRQMRFYDGWIRNEDMPRTIELPVKDFELTVGIRKLDPDTTLKLEWSIFAPQGGLCGHYAVYPAKEGNHTSKVWASSWYTGGTYTLKICVYNITDPNNEILLESRTISIQVKCPGSENAILLDSITISIGTSSKLTPDDTYPKGSEERSKIVVPKPKPQHITISFPRRSFRTICKIFPL